jgi:hypothetical protein
MLTTIAMMAGGVVVAAFFVVPAARAFPATWGALTAAGGIGGIFRRRALRATLDDSPVTPRRAVLAGEFFPTYLPGRGTSRDLASALAQANRPVTAEHASAVCRALRVRAELRDLAGNVQGIIEADGTVQLPPTAAHKLTS